MGDSEDDNSNLLSRIWGAISSIPDKIKELATIVGNFFSSFFSSLGEALSNVVKGIGDFFNSLGSLIGKGFENVVNFIKDTISAIGNIFSWLGSFFSELFNFFYHIFVPTDEQWNSIKQDYKDLGDTFGNHIPFFGFFSGELEKAKEIVYNEDFLNIKFDSWNFNLGIVHFSTPEIQFTGVLKAYEPYRMTIRSALTLIVYGLVVVYIIKYVIRYGNAEGNSNVVDKGGN